MLLYFCSITTFHFLPLPIHVLQRWSANTVEIFSHDMIKGHQKLTRNSSGDEIAKRDLMIIGGDMPDSPV